MDKNHDDLRTFLKSDRAPVEHVEFNQSYRHTRISVNSLTAIAAVLMRERLEHPSYVITGIVLGCLLIVAHASLNRRSSLVEVVAVDTSIYLSMTLLADLPEVAIFIAMAQSFILFFFVRARTALITTGLFTLAGIIAATISIVSQIQTRSAAETAAVVASVTVLTIVPVSWTLLRTGHEMHTHREKEEALVHEKDRLLVDKDRFVASVSHELRTPLTAVVGLAHTLAEARSELTEAERDEFIDTIVEQGEEVAAIVDDLLVAARAGTGHLSLVASELDLGDELRSVVSEEFEFDSVATSPVLIVGDPIRVRQVLRNLLSNCLRYGGDARRVRVFRDGFEGVVSVQDNGPPIPAEQREAIFTAYSRAHDRPGRTDSVGLGLTVSRQLAQMMGGDVHYDHDGKWATFQLRIPIAMREMTQAMYAAPSQARHAHRVPAGQ